MDARQQSLQELQQIKKMMERSSKFSSLSGLSGIAAGVCALVGIWLVVQTIAKWKQDHLKNIYAPEDELAKQLLVIAIVTFMAAAIFSFIFIFLRCKKLGIPVLGRSARRVIINIAIPLFAGALFIFRLSTLGTYELIAPACLIFYGIALVNASKYTLDEIRYMGLTELVIGIINLWILGYGLIFWGIGFGLVHIIYGVIIWWKYERNQTETL
ncbi:MAG: hypothetical protein JWN83_1175 [Chitinophagaceae bacterium]|nr:hypothetical protein [Chitinophagaceae bacterium]